MSIRETLEKNKGIVTIVMVLIIVGAIGVTVYEYRTTFGMGVPGETAYFTIDDGKTLFTDKAGKMAPFDKDGKEAVAAHVFMCGGKQVVGYLTKMSPQAAQVIQKYSGEASKGHPPSNMSEWIDANSNGVQYKRFGTDKWVSPSTDAAEVQALRTFKCPDGSMSGEVSPQ